MTEKRLKLDITPIKDLNINMKYGTIKATVVDKSPIYFYGSNKSNKHFIVNLEDHSGEIKASACDDNVKTFYNLLEVGKEFIISNGKIEEVNKSIHKTHIHDYALLFRGNTKIEASGCPPFKWEPKMISISDLKPGLRNWALKAKVVDRAPIKTFRTTKYTFGGKYFHVNLEDEKGDEIGVEALDNNADTFFDLLAANKEVIISRCQVLRLYKSLNGRDEHYCLLLILGATEITEVTETAGAIETAETTEIEGCESIQNKQDLVVLIDNGEECFGTGFIVHKDGIVVTNYHVVEDKCEINIVLRNKDEYTGFVKSCDSFLDLAIIQIEGGNNFSALNLEDSDNIKADGHTKVWAWGYSKGDAFSNTPGYITSVVSLEEHGEVKDTWATTVSLSSGMSGSPLVNKNGDVIGIMCFRDDENAFSHALPINYLKPLLQSVNENINNN